MSVYIRVGAQRYDAKADETLYQALARQGVVLRKACENGACGICRCQLSTGHIDYRGRAPYGLDETARSTGFILPCIAYPQGDVSLSELRLLQPRSR